jgi:uncharacterized membrane-anchored protein
MFKIIRVALIAFLVSGFLSVVFAADQAPEKKMTADEFMTSLHFQKGKINLPGGIATLDLPDSFRYLPPADAERVLVNAWGNPPGNKTLGMIFPADISPLSESSWGVVVTYDEDGHIKDDDADSIKYDELLTKMKEDNQAANEERKKEGYSPMTLVGWAENPSYDKKTHKFYWAKELSSGKEDETSLNYNIRVLGRKGVLVLNAVASMKQIGQIKQEMQHVVAFTEFSAGNGYNDFDNKTDKIAEYGLAALVAGGVAAKLGFFTKIFALLLAFKKVLLLGLAAISSGIFKFFGRKKDEPTA